jgi:pyruvate ferredoxin oxidoreductase alpha subunit
MLKQIEGSHAVAEAVALSRPEVICAYPISPQTHIVEALGERVKSGSLQPCEFINVESEFAAMSVAIGSSAAGARSYTATASQGLLFMAEAVYNASGLGLPIVMTVANRAIGAPINIWNDHSDSMSQRDCGWIQLFAETNQEAADLHIQAFKLAEDLSMPVMVCMDGFILTHAVERVDMPGQAEVDAFLPALRTAPGAGPAEPVSIGAMVGPGGLHGGALPRARQADDGAASASRRSPPSSASASAATPAGWCARTAARTPRPSWWRWARCWAPSRTRSTSARDGIRIGVLGIHSFRPFPLAAVRAALQARQAGGGAGKELLGRPGRRGVHRRALALSGLQLQGYTVVAGLGGRAITRPRWHRMLREAVAGELPAADLPGPGLAHRQPPAGEREAQMRRSGPIAENLLRDLGTVASKVS